MRAWPMVSHVADFTQGPPNTPGGGLVSLDSTVVASGQPGVRAWSTQRGRQYELNKVQAGTATYDIVDGLEWLNPQNGGSPWNANGNQLLPYRCVQTAAWWNATTLNAAGNIANSTNTPPGSSTAYDPTMETTVGWLGNYGTGAGIAQSTTQAWQGTHSAAVTVTGTGQNAGYGFISIPGQAYTVSAYVYAPTGSVVSMDVGGITTWGQLAGNTWGSLASWADPLPGTGTASSTSTGVWQRLVVTVTAEVGVTPVYLTANGAYTFYLDGVQVEFGSAASAFTATGPTYYPIYTGYVERYPQKWDNAGFRGLKPLDAVDALSPLSRAIINESYAQTILGDSPTVFIPYNDDAFPQTVQQPAGGQPYLGYTQLGAQSGAVNFGGDSFLDGSKAVQITQQNTDPVTSNDTTSNLWTYLGTRQGQISLSTQSYTLECWAKISSGFAYFGLGAIQQGENLLGAYAGPAHWLGFYSYTNGAMIVYGRDPDNNQFMSNNFVTANITTFPDGQWHYWVIRALGSNQFDYRRDANSATVHTYSPVPDPVIAINNIFLQASNIWGSPISESAFANLAVYPTALSNTQLANHYQRGIGYLGELPGNRASRLLNQYWSSNIVTDPGKTALSRDFYYDPPVTPGQPSQAKSVLAALEDIADTENGLTWVDAAGKVHFDSRETRYYNQQSPLYVFGEKETSGELPYLEVEYDYDPTYVYSDAQITCDNTSNVATSVNTASRTNYGQRILSKTMYAENDFDAQQAASFYTTRYAKPAGAPGSTVPPRISRFSIDPASNPKLFQAAFTLDIGSRVTVKRRTSPGVIVSGDYYIEQISHHVNNAASSWTVDYQLSPVFVPQAWVLGDATKSVLGSTTVPIY